MGIPKMFRWLSERYPLVSQLIEENNIPEFDNLYLDMNGIIHNATHNNQGSHLVLPDEKMYPSIFSYIEDLFTKIKPKKLFYMAVDGVAPRAKMNQQRARRFRTAFDREKAKNDALGKGVIVSDDAFDSNCITPGTPFMENLTKHLKYFIHKKISEDEAWRNVEIILSSHEVPGEGEHKIMEYIRLSKAQPDYDPNLRHCLYGLDADLIMLGLLSHDPHFALLREEVQFGRKNQSKVGPPRFFLLHLSLLREYIDADYSEVKDAMRFHYDLERIIDDFIMMIMFVGNDFLPHLPGFDIAEGVLTELFRSYAQWLKTGDGYLNDSGVVNFKRLEQFLYSLHRFEYVQFLNLPDNEDALATQMAGFGQLKLTTKQLEIAQQIQGALDKDGWVDLRLPEIVSFRDIEFLKHLAEDLDFNLKYQYQEDHDPDTIPRLLYSIDNEPTSSEEEANDDEDEDRMDDTQKRRNQLSTATILAKYLSAPVISAEDEHDDKTEAETLFKTFKKHYYNDKLGIDDEDGLPMKKLIQSYVEGVQWVMFYYYKGIPDWGWFYPYHYAPNLSDLKGIGSLEINFELGTPFRPFQQLMGVLPPLSLKLVPEAYRDLMTNPGSSIIDFYPEKFKMDLNGKKNDWEAVVLIPFIEEKRLLKAMSEKEHLLDENQLKRNGFGSAFKYKYDESIDHQILSTLPGFMPMINSKCSESIYHLPELKDGMDYLPGLCPGVKLGKFAPPGFPSLKVLPFTSRVKLAGITVFSHATKQGSCILEIQDTLKNLSMDQLADQKLNQDVYVGYPYLSLAKVIKITTPTSSYQLDNVKVVKRPMLEEDMLQFATQAKDVSTTQLSRKGVDIGEVKALFHVAPLAGMVRTITGGVVRHYAKNVTPIIVPAQLVVFEVGNEDFRFKELDPLTLKEEFPIGSRTLFLGDQHYGSPSKIIGHNNDTLTVKLLEQKEDPEVGLRIVSKAKLSCPYLTVRDLSRITKFPVIAISKITSKVQVSLNTGKRVETYNFGLGLKFEARGQMVVGYARKETRGWEFSPKACELITNYALAFPELFEYLCTDGAKGPIIDATDMFGDEAVLKVSQVTAWLKVQGAKDLVLSSVGSESLDKAAVIEIQQFWDKFYQNRPSITSFDVTNIPRSALLRPTDTSLHLNRQTFSLGDRIVSVSPTSKAPVAIKGTVIGIENSLLEVLFDLTFVAGSNLSGRCNDHRGLWVQPNTILNLTKPQLTPNQITQFLTRDILPLEKEPVKFNKPFQSKPTSTSSNNGNPWQKRSNPSSPNNGGGFNSRGRGNGVKSKNNNNRSFNGKNDQ